MTTSITRRGLLAGVALIAAQAAVGGAAVAFAGEAAPLRPPTAQDEEHLHATCLKCNRCISACPQSCLRSGLLEDGVLNWRTPIMDFRRGACDFCGRCAEVCPTGTITAMTETNRMGVAVVEPERCIAWSAGSSCLVCVDACPYEAVVVDGSGRPVVDAQRCNGCGACEYACPSNSYRAFAGGTLRGINVRVADASTPALDASVAGAGAGAGGDVRSSVVGASQVGVPRASMTATGASASAAGASEVREQSVGTSLGNVSAASVQKEA